jgi:hypothetical protein
MSATIETMVSQLDIFTPPIMQTSVLNSEWIHYKPIQAISDNGPITFFVPGSGSNYVDLNKTMLYVKAKVSKSNGAALTSADSGYTTINNTLNTLWSDVKLEFNNVPVSTANGMYQYKSYFENLFNFSHTAKESHLSGALWYDDSSGSMLDLKNPGNKKRRKIVEKSNEFEMMGKLHCNILSINKYLLNEVDMRFTFSRNNATIVCLSDDPNLDLKVEIIDISLIVRKVGINPGILLAHAKLLETNTCKYPYKRVELNNYTISAGLYSKNIDNLFLNKLPQRVIFGLVRNSAFVGKIDENAFEFETFDLTSLALTVNGRTIGNTPFKMNYEKGLHIMPYIFTHIGVGCHLFDEGFCVSREAFPEGFALYAFDLSPDLNSGDSHWSIEEHGNCRLELIFSKPLPVVCNLIVYSEYNSLCEIDRNRDISVYKR